MAQALDTDSEKETHSFSGMYSSDTAPRSIILFQTAGDAEEAGYFWKLEQTSQPRTFFMPEGSRKSFGRITKVLISRNSCTKLATPWSVARSAINEIYDGMYSVHHRESLIESDHSHYLPAEEIENLAFISFVLRYSVDEVDDGYFPYQGNIFNIDIYGDRLPGDFPDDMKINFRIGRDTRNGMTLFGMQGVFRKNPTGIPVHEINEALISYLLRKFGIGRLMFLANFDEQQAFKFRRCFRITEPIRRSVCILI